MKARNDPICSLSARMGFRVRGILAAWLTVSALTLPACADVGFDLVLWHGYDFYYGDAHLTATNPAPVTYHRVESPNALAMKPVHHPRTMRPCRT